MLSIVFFDGPESDSLLPITYLKPVGLLPVGSGTICERWMRAWPNLSFGFLSKQYLADLYSYDKTEDAKVYINGACLPNPNIVKAISDMPEDGAIFSNESLIAVKTKVNIRSYSELLELGHGCETEQCESHLIRHPENLLDYSEEAIVADFASL